MSIRSLLKDIPPFSWCRRFLLRHGLLDRSSRSVALISFIFQRVLGCNRRVSWPVHFTSSVTVPERIKIGSGVEISFMVSGHCYYQAANGIEIGDGTIWAPGVKMISANHDPADLDRHLPAEPIRIGKGCWIGANAVILPAVQLGDRVVVGAGAVVTKSFPADSVIVGNPARALEKVQRQ